MTAPPPAVPLVASAADVSVDWMDSVLVAAGAVSQPGALESLSGAPIGTGKVGEIVRFELGWRDGIDGPRSVVGKFASDDETSRQAGILTGTYTREVGFYRSLAASVECRVPRCFGLELDPATGEFVIVLEDLRPARAGDQIEGCTPDEAALALTELAGLHAPHWGTSDAGDEDWLAVRSRDGGSGLAMLYDALVDSFSHAYGDRLGTEVIDAAQRLKGRVPAWIALDAEPFTLLHSDFRLENMLFGEPGSDFDIAVVDWQTLTVGPAMSDVAYFLGAALPAAERRRHERELVQVYLDAMAARGVSLDGDRSWAEYRAHAFAGLHMTVVASQLVGKDDRSDEMFCVMAERHAAHVADLDSFELLA